MLSPGVAALGTIPVRENLESAFPRVVFFRDARFVFVHRPASFALSLVRALRPAVAGRPLARCHAPRPSCTHLHALIPLQTLGPVPYVMTWLAQQTGGGRTLHP